MTKRTRREALEALRDMQRRRAGGKPLRDSTGTVAPWSQRWDPTSLAASERRETTKMIYRTLAKTLIRPYLGGIRLDKLRPTDVETWLADLSAAGKSASTRRQALTILRAMLDTAVRDGVVATNVAATVTRPTLRRAEAKHFDASGVAALVAAAQDDQLPPLLITRTEHGLVIQPPKTARGWRTMPLSAPVVAALRAQRQQQRLDRLAAGISWIATDHVFTTTAGTPHAPRNISRWFTALAKRAGVEGSMHATRNTALSGMVNAGVPLAVVSRVAGHESINITIDVYGHVSEQSARDAVDAAVGALGHG
ncbi:tyrosine-type recombinase/integrase [Cellulomonas persica]|uniref:tyrosine-type recombinase/integrase n=1 Tax=Cellulomonas persica TaxID=76861 RepID=UPI001649E135|nr:tyrosine-type recombinase/integrase [Cellulomonas persica]